MVTTHSKGNKDQSRKQQNLKGTYRGAKTHEGNRVSYPSYIHGTKTYQESNKTWKAPIGEQRLTKETVLYPSYIHGPLHTGKNSKSYEKLPRLSNRVVSLIHTWAPPYREELKYCAVGSLLTRSAGHARWPHCARKCRSTGNKKSYEGYHAYRIPCVNHWQEEHLKVKPVPSDYHKSLVLYRYGKNSNVINVIRINVL
jgi:hypothetical protein